ncbi:60S ribosomal protein L34 [Iris pallida]|uniref:60S ribosomal protein L34 n=1 Tax=Iris pallida TaxID=29817 RepID=A0AAX6HSZ7_IRIPA|nr:60S ribosomal protein L34 [Iris pallida]KAJ6843831.1 60S ribosomal protein L34 [Iris pallida]
MLKHSMQRRLFQKSIDKASLTRQHLTLGLGTGIMIRDFFFWSPC